MDNEIPVLRVNPADAGRMAASPGYFRPAGFALEVVEDAEPFDFGTPIEDEHLAHLEALGETAAPVTTETVLPPVPLMQSAPQDEGDDDDDVDPE